MSASMPKRIAVIGAGSWGTTVASLVSMNTDTVLWSRRSELADTISTTHRNPSYLDGIDLSPTLQSTHSLAEAVAGSEVVVMAVPSNGFRDILMQVRDHLEVPVPIVSLAKGLEGGTGNRMTQVIAEVLPGFPCAVLTGPNLAREIALGQPAASVVASDDVDIARQLQNAFNRPTWRIYTNSDVVGCEIAGVVKNVIAIGAGMAFGLGFGDNTRAALITRGLAEITRLAVAMGARPETFAGLAGMGDLIATCASSMSRNNTVGRRLGQGESLASIVESTSMVAEGVKSSAAVLELARTFNVDMPITEQVVAVCHHGVSAADATKALMTRALKPETH
jgi:glycerol-3-phosphate dehydrogenase (NAD(P)+)